MVKIYIDNPYLYAGINKYAKSLNNSLFNVSDHIHDQDISEDSDKFLRIGSTDVLFSNYSFSSIVDCIGDSDHMVLGYQRHLKNGIHVNSISLGSILSNDQLLLDQIRTQCSVIINPRVLSKLYYKGSQNQLAGLDIYHWTSVFREAGLNHYSLKTLLSFDESEIHSSFIECFSLAIWYYLEGYYLSKSEMPYSDKVVKKTVMYKDDLMLHFVNGHNSNRWWLLKPGYAGDKITDYIPCTKSDYLSTVNGSPSSYIIDRL